MDLANRFKAGLVSAAFKLMSPGERRARIFLETSQSAFKPVVLLPVSATFTRKILARLKDVRKRAPGVWTGAVPGNRGSKVPVTVVRQQLGAPHGAIVMEVLKDSACRVAVRVDFAGGVGKGVEVGHLCVPGSAFCGDGTTPHYLAPEDDPAPLTHLGETPPVADADPELRDLLLRTASELAGERRVHEAPVWTTDAIFRETPPKLRRWRELGAACVDMESSVLFLLGRKFGIRVAAVLAVSDVPGHPEHDLGNAERMHPQLESGADRAVKAVLGAVARVKV